MKIIYDDIIYSLQRSGGISLYWSKLETYLNQNIRLLYRNHEDNIFYSSSSAAKQIISKNLIILERYTNVAVLEKTPFLFHSSYFRYCKNKNAINITTVHDFVYEYFRHDLKSVAHKVQKRKAISNSQGVIFVSESTKKDFEFFFPDFKGKKKIIYHGIAAEYTNLSLPKKNNVIFIGGRANYKNFIHALKIMQKMAQFTLQIIGGGHLSKEEIICLNKYIPGRYEYYQSLSNEELNLKYNEAYFLLYPSLYEGFGFPVVEAQSARCPVVCCYISSLPEVAGDAAVYISGKDIDDDLKKVSQLDDKNTYNALCEKGLENCKKFTWKKCAEETYDFYEELYELYKGKG